MIDARLATLKPGDMVNVLQDGTGVPVPLKFLMLTEGQKFFVYTYGTYDYPERMRVRNVDDILWPPAPKATPGVVYRHKDGASESVGLADGQLRICCTLSSHVYMQQVIPFHPDWLPVDPQEERP